MMFSLFDLNERVGSRMMPRFRTKGVEGVTVSLNAK